MISSASGGSRPLEQLTDGQAVSGNSSVSGQMPADLVLLDLAELENLQDATAAATAQPENEAPEGKVTADHTEISAKGEQSTRVADREPSPHQKESAPQPKRAPSVPRMVAVSDRRSFEDAKRSLSQPRGSVAKRGRHPKPGPLDRVETTTHITAIGDSPRRLVGQALSDNSKKQLDQLGNSEVSSRSLWLKECIPVGEIIQTWNGLLQQGRLKTHTTQPGDCEDLLRFFEKHLHIEGLSKFDRVEQKLIYADFQRQLKAKPSEMHGRSVYGERNTAFTVLEPEAIAFYCGVPVDQIKHSKLIVTMSGNESIDPSRSSADDTGYFQLQASVADPRSSPKRPDMIPLTGHVKCNWIGRGSTRRAYGDSKPEYRHLENLRKALTDQTQGRPIFLDPWLHELLRSSKVEELQHAAWPFRMGYILQKSGHQDSANGTVTYQYQASDGSVVTPYLNNHHDSAASSLFRGGTSPNIMHNACSEQKVLVALHALQRRYFKTETASVPQPSIAIYSARCPCLSCMGGIVSFAHGVENKTSTPQGPRIRVVATTQPDNNLGIPEFNSPPEKAKSGQSAVEPVHPPRVRHRAKH